MQSGREHFDRAVRQHVLERRENAAGAEIRDQLVQRTIERLLRGDARDGREPRVPRPHDEPLVGRENPDWKTLS